MLWVCVWPRSAYKWPVARPLAVRMRCAFRDHDDEDAEGAIEARKRSACTHNACSTNETSIGMRLALPVALRMASRREAERSLGGIELASFLGRVHGISLVKINQYVAMGGGDPRVAPQRVPH